jgi:hypothetical protein
MSATPNENVVRLSPRQTPKGRHRSKGKPPVDPILAAIANHRRVLDEWSAAESDYEQVKGVNAETPILKRSLAVAKAECDRLDEAELRALSALGSIKPTTPAGAGALVAYVCKNMKEISGAEWHENALANVARALAAMRVRT